MRKRNYSVEKFNLLSGYYSNISVAWFSAGVIVPFFSHATLQEKVIYMIEGFILSYLFINIALYLKKRTV